MRIFRCSLAGSLALVGSLSLLACGSDGGNGNGTTDPPTTGEVRATVTMDGAPESGVTVRLYAPGAANPSATQTTASNGTTTFGNLEPGGREVEVVVPQDAMLADGEQARKNTSVTAGQTATLSFALESESQGNVVEILAQDDLTFSPSQVTVSVGTTVRWRSTSSMLHTVTPQGHTLWTSATLASSGSVFEYTFTETGTYSYYCQPHLGAGMTGQVTVQ